MCLVLRLCAESRGVKWGFWPPGAQPEINQETGGIWIPGAYNAMDRLEMESLGSGGESEPDEGGDEESYQGSDSGQSGDDSEGTDLIAIAGGSRFGALSLNDGDES